MLYLFSVRYTKKKKKLLIKVFKQNVSIKNLYHNTSNDNKKKKYKT